ncbi:MAG: cytochrome c [Gemmatimonadaceae bacterium]|nr:cytochrome c [Gemmatimonadaceae bacterium]
MPVTHRAPRPLDSPDDARALDRWHVAGLLCMLALILAFPVYNLGEPARRARAQEEMARANVRLGRTMFAQHCASCHGDEARGGRGSPTLAAREFLGSVSDRQLHWLISGGIPGSVMSAYDIDLGGPFTAQEIARLAAYLRSLEAGAPSVSGWFTGALAPPRSVAAAHAGKSGGGEGRGERRGQAGNDDAPGRGRDSLAPTVLASAGVAEVYATRCAMCHGVRGEGTAIAPVLRPMRAPLVAEPDLAYRKITHGVPGTAMGAFSTKQGGALDETAIRALVAWMREATPPPR